MTEVVKSGKRINDLRAMAAALKLARKGYGMTSPNPMVGAVLVKGGKIIGQGWHKRAGEPHAEIEAIRDAQRRGHKTAGSTLYVTLEPCSTHGRTPPCTDAIVDAGIRKVIVAGTDPNPAHAGNAYRILKRVGIKVEQGILADEANVLNEAFNHWIVHRTPFVSVKAAMTLDGKIGTANGESKWITGTKARAYGNLLRAGTDAILVGINTVLADDPSLAVKGRGGKCPIRVVLDTNARTPLKAKVVSDKFRERTIIVVGQSAPKSRVKALSKRVRVLVALGKGPKQQLMWFMKKLGAEDVTSLLVEGGGEVNASFLLGGFAHRVAFFYAPKVLGGKNARKGVAGDGVQRVADMVRLRDVKWQWLGKDLLLTARVS